MSNTLYYGDNLGVLRNSIADESVDLIYLDPPFNSNATYNVLFKTPKGIKSDAQIEAFDDTWHWGPTAEAAYTEVLQQNNTDVTEVLTAFRTFLGDNDMMAYIVMMSVRLLELHRVLKSTGSMYLHCDPTASHYLKIVLDAVFGKGAFRNEIIWKRNNSHSSGKRFGRIHDTIFFYTKGSKWTWNWTFGKFSEEQLGRFEEDEDGRLYKAENLTAERKNSNSGKFEWRGTIPGPTRGWAHTQEQLEEWWDEGLILTKKDGTPRLDGLKIYLDDLEGAKSQDIWIDIPRVANISHERLGYDTQKPLALLERIISASSNEGDVVLDPFCGCGTAVHAAQKLGRKWLGIDVTHLAISLIEKRLKDAFPGIAFEVHGTPKDIGGARDLAERDKHEFQLWACSLVTAQAYKGGKKGADSGIDGVLYFQDDKKLPKKIVVSVKGGENVSVPMIRDFGHVIDREKAAMGFFVTLTSPTKPMAKEAVGAGYYTSDATGSNYGKIQILTIEGLMNGTERPSFPRLDAGITFKKAKREEKAPDQPSLI